jgi:hypothetical protein
MAFIDQSGEFGTPPPRLQRQPDVDGPRDRTERPDRERGQMPSLDKRDRALAHAGEYRDVALAKATSQPDCANCRSDPNVIHGDSIAGNACPRIIRRLFGAR